MMATDLADYLVVRGVPFREAHALTGQAVRAADKLGLTLQTLPISEYQAISSSIDESVYQVFEPGQSIARRNAIGGTARNEVIRQLNQAKEIVLRESVP
jgi:argininosuccinate lyase